MFFAFLLCFLATTEQLNRVEGNLDGMNAEMKTAEQHLTSMEKWCGLCVCPWNRTPRVRDMDATWGKGEAGKQAPVSIQPRPGTSSGPSGGGGGQQGGYVTRITNCAREDEMDDNLGQVSNMLGDLKNMAQDMGEAIGSQNKQIDRITGKVRYFLYRVCQDWTFLDLRL